jgi:hypothetical protein
MNNCLTKTNLRHYLSFVYFVNHPLHVSGIFVAYHQEVYCVYKMIKQSLCTCFLYCNRQVHRDFLITLYVQQL